MFGEEKDIIWPSVATIIPDWYYQTLAGINYDPQQPGFKHIILRPRPVGDLTFVSASHKCLYGAIRSAWRIQKDTFTWNATVPPNTAATVFVPTTDAASVSESGKPAAGSADVKFLRSEPACAVYEVSSKRYEFQYTFR